MGTKQNLQNRVLRALRAEIVDGMFGGGGPLPSQAALAERFGVSTMTIRVVTDRLIRDGFLRSEPRIGMFVVEHPPHQSHYALAFPFREEEMRRSQFYEALRNEAVKLQSPSRRFSIFYDISGHVDTEDYERLERHVKAHTLAGVIFAASPFMLHGLAVVEETGIPRVAVASAPSEWAEGVPTVCTVHVLPAALDCLKRQGCRRVAVLLPTTRRGKPPSDTHLIEQAIRAAGLETRTAWIQYVFPDHALPICQLTRLLFHGPAHQCPDGLVIADDNLVPAATAGLIAEGVRVPEDLKVVAHTNYPWPTASAVPVQRVGVDVTRLLEHCVEVIDLQRRGESVPTLTHANDTLVVGEQVSDKDSNMVTCSNCRPFFEQTSV